MDILINTRHRKLPESFDEHAHSRLEGIGKLISRVIRVEVLVSPDDSKRFGSDGAKVEITVIARGPAIRAEADGPEPTAAFDSAMDRLRAQLRRAADRRKPRRGQQSARTTPVDLPVDFAAEPSTTPEPPKQTMVGIEVTGEGPLVVREKTHTGHPMTAEQAIEQMELVGHDFFLFVDAETRVPSVAYRRRAYDFGVIRLDVQEDSTR